MHVIEDKCVYKFKHVQFIVGMAGASNTYSTSDHLGFVIGYMG
jgi:hypothetical protein